MQKLRTVFMGTPDFAVASLKILVEAGENIVGVITAPDKPQGRGKQIGESAVKQYAQSAGLEILQPTNLKSPEFLAELASLRADLQIVVAFRMLPESVWSMPPMGTFNLHASLLPQYRGAAPIHWAVINGETVTGVTTFFLQHEIDTGDIIFQEKEPIAYTDTLGDVYDRLMNKGAGLVLKTVAQISKGACKQTPQDFTETICHAPKLSKEICEIDWNRPAEEMYNFIRGLNPFPSAWTTLHGKQLKVFFAMIEIGKKLTPGLFESDGKSYIRVGTATHALLLKDIQMEGKKRMSAEELLRGYRWPQ